MKKTEREALRREAYERHARRLRLIGETISLDDVLVGRDEISTSVQEKLGCTAQWARTVVNSWYTEGWINTDSRAMVTLVCSSENRGAEHVDETRERVARTSQRNGAFGGRPPKR